ncbi:hypothetical protein PROFUN_15173, partial [Planoprotostelium fungivorum]
IVSIMNEGWVLRILGLAHLLTIVLLREYRRVLDLIARAILQCAVPLIFQMPLFSVCLRSNPDMQDKFTPLQFDALHHVSCLSRSVSLDNYPLFVRRDAARHQQDTLPRGKQKGRNLVLQMTGRKQKRTRGRVSVSQSRRATPSFCDISVFEKHNFLKETFTGYFHRDLEETSLL